MAFRPWWCRSPLWSPFLSSCRQRRPRSPLRRVVALAPLRRCGTRAAGFRTWRLRLRRQGVGVAGLRARSLRRCCRLSRRGCRRRAGAARHAVVGGAGARRSRLRWERERLSRRGRRRRAGAARHGASGRRGSRRCSRRRSCSCAAAAPAPVPLVPAVPLLWASEAAPLQVINAVATSAVSDLDDMYTSPMVLSETTSHQPPRSPHVVPSTR